MSKHILFPADPRIKPSVPVEIDWSNPLTKGLVLDLEFINGSLVDLVSGEVFEFIGSPTLGHDEQGSFFDLGLTSDSWGFQKNNALVGLSGTEHTVEVVDAIDVNDTFGHVAFGWSDNGTAYWQINQLGDYNIGAGVSITSTTTHPVDGNFHSTIFSASSGNNVVYLDGVANGSAAGSQSLNAGAKTLRIGTWNAGDGRFDLDGRIRRVRVWNRPLSAQEARSLNQNPYQLLKPALPLAVEIAEEETAQDVIPVPKQFQFPADPTRKPIGNYEIDWSHPLVKHADNLLLFNERGGGLPYDEAQNEYFTADTTQGTTPYEYQPVNGAINFVGQTTGSGNGIAYESPKDYDAFGSVASTSPHYLFMVYTLTEAPSATASGIVQIGNDVEDGGPSFLLNSTAGGTDLRVYVNGGYRFTGIPADVGKRHVLCWHFDGSTHTLYDSAKGEWETFSGTISGFSGDFRLWIGTGFQQQLDGVAFEFLSYGVIDTPTLGQCKEFVKAPYEFLKPSQDWIVGSASTGGGSDPQDIALGLQSDAESLLSLTPSAGAVSQAIGLQTDTESVFSITSDLSNALSLGIQSESESELSFTPDTTFSQTIGLQSDTESTFPFGSGGDSSVEIGLITDTETGLSFSISTELTTAIGLQTDTESLFGLSPVGEGSYLLGVQSDTETTLGFTSLQDGVGNITTVSEIESLNSLNVITSLTEQIGLQSDTEALFNISPDESILVNLGLVVDSESTLGFTSDTPATFPMALITDTEVVYNFTPPSFNVLKYAGAKAIDVTPVIQLAE